LSVGKLWFLPRDATHSAVMPQYVVCPSVRPSVTFRYRDHTGWNTSKIISRMISLRFMVRLVLTQGIWSNGNAPKLEYNSLCLCEIIPRVLLT